MRLAINAAIVDPVPTGLGVYTVNVLKELAQLHDDLVVYTSCPEACGLNATKVRHISTKVQPARGRRGHFCRFVWTQTSLPLRLLADRVSLLLSLVHEGILFPFRGQGIVVHDLIPIHFPEVLPRQYLYFRYCLPVLLRHARIIIAVSESTKRDMVAFYGTEPGRIHVVPNGVDASRYRIGIDATSIKRKYGLTAYMLYVGNLLPHKNLHRLLHAFARISTKCPYALVIVGRKDPRYYPALEVEARALGLEGRVLFLDYVPPEELPALYAGAELFVLPSLHEGFGLPVLEAMACGTPVMVSRTTSLPEVAGDAAVLIDPHNVLEIAEAMQAVLEDGGRRTAMRREGREQAAQFTWRRTALMLLHILNQVGEG